MPSGLPVALLAGVLATTVEVFKLYHAPARDAFRLSLSGILLLGRIFSVWEIIAYWLAISAGAFLDYWCHRALRSRLEPMQKVARMLRAHEELLLNWFRAKGEISSGAVEGLNNKTRVITRRSFGFRTFKAMQMALYHTLGRLPEPETARRFC
jgi:hypothetical protein